MASQSSQNCSKCEARQEAYQARNQTRVDTPTESSRSPAHKGERAELSTHQSLGHSCHAEISKTQTWPVPMRRSGRGKASARHRAADARGAGGSDTFQESAGERWDFSSVEERMVGLTPYLEQMVRIICHLQHCLLRYPSCIPIHRNSSPVKARSHHPCAQSRMIKVMIIKWNQWLKRSKAWKMI